MTDMKKYLRLARKDLLYILPWQAGFFLFGVGLVLVINASINDEKDLASMGTLFALMGTVVGLFVRGGNAGYVRLRLAVTMGMTRRSFLIWEPLLTAAATALAILFVRCLYGLELALYRQLYPGFVNEIPLDMLFRWQVLVPAGACVVAASLFIVMLIQRGGMRIFGVLWVVFCFGCFLLPRGISAYQDGKKSLLAMVGGWMYNGLNAITPAAWGAVAAAAVIAMAAAGVLGLRRAEIRL